jgi:hypothetical protein
MRDSQFSGLSRPSRPSRPLQPLSNIYFSLCWWEVSQPFEYSFSVAIYPGAARTTEQHRFNISERNMSTDALQYYALILFCQRWLQDEVDVFRVLRVKAWYVICVSILVLLWTQVYWRTFFDSKALKGSKAHRIESCDWLLVLVVFVVCHLFHLCGHVTSRIITHLLGHRYQS